MLSEAMDWLDVREDCWYVDANLGGGGHSRAILERGGRVLAIDRDPDAVARFLEESGEAFSGRFLAIHGNNADIAIHVREARIRASGILFDLGWSTIQGEEADRGLSFSEEGPLDMRLDQTTGETAGALLERVSESELSEILSEGDEPLAHPIARALVQARKSGRLPRTTVDLAAFVSGVYYRKGFRRSRRHPATRVFMALRIRVNREYENLERSLAGSRQALEEGGGRLLVLTFHSGEDRIVKRTFRQWVSEEAADYLFRKSLPPGKEEVLQNPRSRSARMRGVTFVGG
ncbi:MAG: 16S rRNA (cytosine(1402)-N(4))-methyltransferase RsmH [Nitrospirae bacterium]|nr:16S rRNA (cytosine(1402)-N(4))-methyltransferase RsmH [Nitrospirota bacterium]